MHGLTVFYHVFCPEVSASIFQNRLPGATGVLPRFGSFRSQSGCAFESTILPPCVRELMWLVRMGAIWIDMGSVACVFLKTPRWSGWRDRKDHDDVMDSDFSNFPKKIEEWSNLKTPIYKMQNPFCGTWEVELAAPRFCVRFTSSWWNIQISMN